MWWRTSFTSNWATLVRALVRHLQRLDQGGQAQPDPPQFGGQRSGIGVRQRREVAADELAQAVGVFPGAEQGDHQLIGGAERLRMAGPEGIPALRQRALK